ncbi:hypothetical protein RJ639_011404 [Escallonia herrerae]|uniref:Uncharacterized protein n=1 Tax=Escallonia herrerae TaxID=1293975 RepID=A0AA89ARG3_9ASTE|nr:hypothetical protein RJ639_011404 [Escallonia herrerae]
MSQYNQNQPPESYPPPGTANPQKSRMEAPPPAGYPTRDGPQVDATSGKTQSRGDGFWKGW